MVRNRRTRRRDSEEPWPPPNLTNFSTNPEPYHKKDGTVVYLTHPIVRLKIHKKTVEELLGLKKPEN